MTCIDELGDHPVINLLMRTGVYRSEETYRCPCCGGDLSPEEHVYLDNEGIVGCEACLCVMEAQDILGPDSAA